MVIVKRWYNDEYDDEWDKDDKRWSTSGQYGRHLPVQYSSSNTGPKPQEQAQVIILILAVMEHLI